MIELLGLCKGASEENGCKKNGKNDPNEADSSSNGESQYSMRELLGLCSGKFTNESNENGIESEMDCQHVNELSRLSSGSFLDTSERKHSLSLDDERSKGCEGKEKLLVDDSEQFERTKDIYAFSRSSNSGDLFESNVCVQGDSTLIEKREIIDPVRECSGQDNKGSVGNLRNGGTIALNDGSKKGRRGLFELFDKVDDSIETDDVLALCSGKVKQK